jgi:hypothetical protein
MVPGIMGWGGRSIPRLSTAHAGDLLQTAPGWTPVRSLKTLVGSFDWTLRITGAAPIRDVPRLDSTGVRA